MIGCRLLAKRVLGLSPDQLEVIGFMIGSAGEVYEDVIHGAHVVV